MRGKVRPVYCCLMLLLCMGASSAFPLFAATFHRRIRCNGRRYDYAVYVPPTYDAARPMPAILLVHGAGGNGPDFLALWTGLAKKNGIVLVAPTLPRDLAIEAQVPQLFPALMDAVSAQWKLDPKRIYLFGYSAGGYYTFDAAMMDSNYFAAAGVFAAIIAPEYRWIVQKANRNMPIALYIGDRDQFFSLQQTAATRDFLRKDGFNVRYVTIRNQDHYFPAASDVIEQDVWKFLQQFSLAR